MASKKGKKQPNKQTQTYSDLEMSRAMDRFFCIIPIKNYPSALTTRYTSRGIRIRTFRILTLKELSIRAVSLLPRSLQKKLPPLLLTQLPQYPKGMPDVCFMHDTHDSECTLCKERRLIVRNHDL